MQPRPSCVGLSNYNVEGLGSSFPKTKYFAVFVQPAGTQNLNQEYNL